MYRLKILSVGKAKESWLNDGIDEYTKRLKSLLSIEWVLTKNSSDLEEKLALEKHYGALDPAGPIYTSEQFSSFLIKQLEKNKSRLSLVIGGAEGLTEPMRKGAAFFLSLSPLTFTHQLTRLVLIEQIYRAFEIHKGSPYHK